MKRLPCIFPARPEALAIVSALIVSALWVTSCRDWSAPEFPAPDDGTIVKTSTIGKFRGDANGQPRLITEQTVLTGRVVSSDRAGNFYNTFFIEDGTGAAEIMAGMYDLDAVYHLGQLIAVHTKGLAIGFKDGAMQIGLPPGLGSGYSTGYFYHPAVIRKYIFATRDVSPVAPLDITIAQLTAVDPPATEPIGTALCGRLVRIENLTLDPLETATSWAVEPNSFVSYGDVKFLDPSNNEIIVRTSSYATFAAAPVPTATISLTGVLFYDGSRYFLKLRDLNDVIFSTPVACPTRLKNPPARSCNL